MSELYLPAGTAAAGPYDLEITPTSAGWGYSSLRVITLDAGAEHGLSCGGEEIIVVPLSGGASVITEQQTFTLVGRTDVFAGPTDFVYLPAGSTATLASSGGGRYALCGAVSDADLQIPLGDAPIPVRAGQPCPPELGPIKLSIAETTRLTGLAACHTKGLITRARLAFALRWSLRRRLHQARARWHHYSTRLQAVTDTG